MSCCSIPAATEEVAPAEAAAEAEVPPMDQAAPAEEILPAPSPLLVVLEQLPGGSPDPPLVPEPPTEGTLGGPSTAEGAPEETIGGVSGLSLWPELPPTRCPRRTPWSGPQQMRVSLTTSRRMTTRWGRLRSLSP